jgi:hypothetical protein
MSTRAIAEAVGASDFTVRKDIERSGASDNAPEQPKRVTGKDGKVYPAKADPEKIERRNRIIPQIESKIPERMVIAARRWWGYNHVWN